MATSTSVLKQYKEAGDTFTDFDISKHLKNPFYAVQDIYPVNDTSVLVGTMFNALLLNPANGSIINVLKESGSKTNIQVHKIVQQSSTEYWLGTETGVCVVDISTKKIVQIQKERENPYSLTDNVIYTLYKDREGSIWLGSFSGGVS